MKHPQSQIAIEKSIPFSSIFNLKEGRGTRLIDAGEQVAYHFRVD